MWSETLGAEMEYFSKLYHNRLWTSLWDPNFLFRESHTECDLIGSSALPAHTQSAGARMTILSQSDAYSQSVESTLNGSHSWAECRC